MTARTRNTGLNAGLVLGVWALLTAGVAVQAQDASPGGAAIGQASGSTATTAATTTTTSAGDAALQKTLQQTYDRCVAATKKRDESVLAAVRTHDFVYKEANGKTYTRDQIENTERTAMSQVQTIQSLSSQISSVSQEKGKVTANVRQSFVGTILDTQNKTHVMNMTTTTRDVWTQASGVWKLQSVQVVSRKDTYDGKAFDPSAAPAATAHQNANNNGSGNRGYANNNGYRAPTYHPPHTRKIKGSGQPITLP